MIARAGALLAIVGLSRWTGSVACLGVNESRLVFQTDRTRFAAPAAFGDPFQLSTPDGLRLDARRPRTVLADPG